MITISATCLNYLLAEAQRVHPYECCGILFGDQARITEIVPTRNGHPRRRTHFELDPQALVDAYRAEREGGPRIAGFYHSHPDGSPVPSRRDEAAAARDGKVWAITGQGEVRFWRDMPGGFEPLPYTVLER